MRPGNPLTPFCSVSGNSPASRFDSPSRSRRRVVTVRWPNDGMLIPAITTSAPRDRLSTVTSSRMSPSSVTVGVMSTFTPTSLY